jgi:putative transcriptional regulator
MNTIQIGSLLVAAPTMDDDTFEKAVVLLCENEADAKFGFIINKKMVFTLDEMVDEVTVPNIELYCGGPADLSALQVVHQYPDLFPDAFPITKDLFLGGDMGYMFTLINEQKLDLTKMKFFLGYSGWDFEQLYSEIFEEQSWLITPADATTVFQKEVTHVWQNTLDRIETSYDSLKTKPIDPNLN